jgi:hypothetical protein
VKLVVKPHNPRVRVALWTAAAAGCVTLIAGAYFFGEWRGGYERFAARAQIAALTQSRDTFARANGDLRQQMVFLKRSMDIDRTAQTHVQEANAKLQSQVVDLQKQLSFYRDIITPANGTRAGVRVQALTLVADGAPHHFHYSVVLMQAPRHDRTTSGTMTLRVLGKRDGKDAALDFAALDGKAARMFKFRYFENLQGDLKLPAGFSPERVEVTVTPKGRHSDPLTRDFDWHITG